MEFNIKFDEQMMVEVANRVLEFFNSCPTDNSRNRCCQYFEKGANGCRDCWLDWLKSPVEEVDE